MNFVERYNFIDKLLPYGEDRISYQFENGNLILIIYYDDCAKSIQLCFEGCAYQYFSPIPGYQPDQLVVEFQIKSSRVYELLDSNLLLGSEEFYRDSSYKPNRRHFFLYLEWANVALHVVASSVLFDEDEVKALLL